MGDVTAAIQKYIDNEIRLSRADVSSAVQSREWFLQRIANVVSGREGEPALYSEPFVYFGSYFKGTKVRSVDEYDVLVVIDSNGGVFSCGGVQIGTGLGSASPNYKYNGRFHKSDGSGVSPSKMLNWLKGIVQEVTDSFGGEAPERNGQAITATIKSKDLRIDLVPAGIFQRGSDGTVFYDIPRGDRDNGWILTSPRQDIDLLKEVAREKDNFRNIVRLAKRMKDTYNFLVSSFAIETAVVLFGEQNYWHGDLYRDVCRALNYLAGLFRNGEIPDSFDAGNNLISGVASLSWYADRLDSAVAELDDCHNNVDAQEEVNLRVKKVFENES